MCGLFPRIHRCADGRQSTSGSAAFRASRAGSPAAPLAFAAAGFRRRRPPRDPRRVFFFGLGASPSVDAGPPPPRAGSPHRRAPDPAGGSAPRRPRADRSRRLCALGASVVASAFFRRRPRAIRAGCASSAWAHLPQRPPRSAPPPRAPPPPAPRPLPRRPPPSVPQASRSCSGARVGFSASASAVIGGSVGWPVGELRVRRSSRTRVIRTWRACRRASRPLRWRCRCRRASCRRSDRGGRPPREELSSWPSSTGASGWSFASGPRATTSKCSGGTPSFGSMKIRRRVRSSMARSRSARSAQPRRVGSARRGRRRCVSSLRASVACVPLRRRRRPPRRRCRRPPGRAALREDLAWPVRDVLARHLHEAERRDLDDGSSSGRARAPSSTPPRRRPGSSGSPCR